MNQARMLDMKVSRPPSSIQGSAISGKTCISMSRSALAKSHISRGTLSISLLLAIGSFGGLLSFHVSSAHGEVSTSSAGNPTHVQLDSSEQPAREEAKRGPTGPKRWRILPLGDSITSGVPRCPTYRYWLWKKLSSSGYHFDFIGSQKTHWTKRLKQRYADWNTFDGDHEGHGGWKTDRMVRSLPDFLESYTPDVVLLHFGTNDVSSGDSTKSTLQELDQLIGILQQDNPEVVVLLAKIIPIDGRRNSGVQALNKGLDSIVAARRKGRAKMIVVDHFSGFDAKAQTFDGIHPNELGEKIMATRWYDALVNVLGKSSTP